MVDSCGECEYCKAGEEQYCLKGAVGTYNGRGLRRRDRPTAATASRSSSTSTSRSASPRASSSTSPRRCCAPASRRTRRCATGTSARARRSPSSAWAGSATWASSSPRAMGAEVTVLSQHARASRRTACASAPTHYYATSDDGDVRRAARRRFDLILNTVSREPADRRLPRRCCARRRAGDRRRADASPTVRAFVAHRRQPRARRLGHRRHRRRPRRCSTSAPSTASAPRSRLIGADQVNEAYERVVNSDVRYRFVIDTATIEA